jgi:hypothetical protein
VRQHLDLLGEPLPAAHQIRKDGGRRKVGYAARPGSGPKGQRCANCAHCSKVLHKGYESRKCERMAHAWTHGSETDIKPNAPACRQWERRPFKPAKP